MKYAEIVILYYNKVKRFHENFTKKFFKDTRIVISLPWGDTYGRGKPLPQYDVVERKLRVTFK